MSHPRTMPPPRRRRWPLLLLVLFVAMPVLELYVLIQVGQVIGAWWTILLLILAGVLGSWLIKREGARAWAALRTTLAAGRMPAREIADGALVLLGGTLMLSPGFVSDAFGILLILPVTRPFFRRLLTSVVARRLVVVGPLGPGGPGAGPGNDGRPGPDVVRGDVVDEP
ncbi:FxsA family protein [Nocardioides marmotae]|uniref:FxsA family protein n=1 Tax=Nocardioides marmotae TaxID=2663857 RepID=A0A6I3JAH8_9ACTN|nr:FxsA family protein [Nocardioides marmotae]MCR6030838.1 FxsA family protein [Gordonia jinghuaiqii]MBC9733896.1 FxsA family protein [Nocardioides marmotae]MTB85000.1 FxsA family protein [Nocardioides marmotae]MTB94475.1 FxsA family protein [Nocardioides marmotae]QKE01503.1 FxsA family protein [Nocardioides marmotae]